MRYAIRDTRYAPETRVKSKNTRAFAAVAGEETFSTDNSLHG